MKAILSYGNYFSYGKDYQVKFIYENELEAQNITSILKQFEAKKLINPYYTKFITKRSDHRAITVINKTNIPKDILLPFISMLITINNVNLTIGNKEFNTFNADNVLEAIDNLHINGILNKGEFFTMGYTYYISFRYASEDQKDELLYYFNCKSNNDIYPIAIDKLGNITTKNNGTIICANVPKGMLNNIIKDFIEKYNMIITIGNHKLKDNFNEEELEKALCAIEVEERVKRRTRIKQGTR